MRDQPAPDRQRRACKAWTERTFHFPKLYDLNIGLHIGFVKYTIAFFKQWGEWIDDDNIDSANLRAPQVADPNEFFSEHNWKDGLSSWRVGKKAAGRLLDGSLHDAYPR